MFRVLIAAALACAIPFAAAQQSADAVLKRVADALGANDVKTLKYTAEGTGYTYGQAYVPGAAWPKITVHSQVRTINYETGSMREDFTLSRAEPQGGGGYPLSGQQRNETYVSGASAWNVVGGNAVAGARFADDRAHQLWITPHGVVKLAMKSNAMSADAGGGRTAITFTDPGRFSVIAYVGPDNLIERVASRIPDPVLGEVTVVTTYSDYRDFGGVRFPTHIQQSAGGFPTLDVTVKDVQPSAPADITAPDNVRNAAERVAVEKVAEGVWFLAGGSHNSAAIEMKDHVVLVEAPLNEARTGAVIDQVKQLVPGKPLRYVVNSHNHFDHSGGLRTAAAEGMIIVTHADNAAYFRQAFATPAVLRPDRLAKSGRSVAFLPVGDRYTLTDGTRTIEILRITGSNHNDTFLMVYLPAERLLIEADGYTPLPPNAPPPETPNAGHLNLIENIERNKLVVDKILPLHGRVVPVAELYTTAKATPK